MVSYDLMACAPQQLVRVSIFLHSIVDCMTWLIMYYFLFFPNSVPYNISKTLTVLKSILFTKIYI